MDPHIGKVVLGDIVGKPFMTGLMDDDKIEFQSPTGT